jgi:hypothetical protein
MRRRNSRPPALRRIISRHVCAVGCFGRGTWQAPIP